MMTVIPVLMMLIDASYFAVYMIKKRWVKKLFLPLFSFY